MFAGQLNIMSRSLPRALHSGLSVAENSRRLRILALIEERLMEIQSAWLASIPQVEVKDLLGQYIFEDADHSNELRRRAHDLVSLVERTADSQDTGAIQAICNEIGNATELSERWAGMYRVFKPELIRHYEEHLALTDRICDAPTARILERILPEEESQLKHIDDVLEQWPLTPTENENALAWQVHLRSCLERMHGLIDPSAVDLPRFHHPEPLPRFLDTFPERDGRWQYLPLDAPPVVPVDASPEKAAELLLATLSNGEYEAAELLARTLVDFPEAPWELRFRIARQVWDEVRHGEMQLRRLAELGKKWEGIPVKRLTYSKAGFERDLGRRLMVLNRVTEGRAMDLNLKRFDYLTCQAHDPLTPRFFDYILADETQHIENGNWIKILSDGDGRQEAGYVQFGEDFRRELEEFIGGRADIQAMSTERTRAVGEKDALSDQ